MHGRDADPGQRTGRSSKPIENAIRGSGSDRFQQLRGHVKDGPVVYIQNVLPHLENMKLVKLVLSHHLRRRWYFGMMPRNVKLE